MKNTKTEFRYFTIADWKEEEEYLRRRHQEGWRFEGVSFPGIYRFSRCQPEDVVYQLDYNPEGLADRESYLKLFSDCGWEHLVDFVGYSYFRKPAAAMQGGEEEIFCDDDSRRAMLLRVLRRRLPPLILLFFVVVLPNFLLGGQDPTVRLLFGLLGAVYLLLFCRFLITWRRLRKD